MDSEETKRPDSQTIGINPAATKAEEIPLLIKANVSLVNANSDPGRAQIIGWFRSGVDLVKALVWPSLILYVFWTLRAPIRQILVQVPIELSQAQKITYGSLSVEIQTQAIHSGGIQLADVLKSLSADAIAALMEIDERTTFGFLGQGKDPDSNRDVYWAPTFERVKLLRELWRRGLVHFNRDPDEFKRIMDGSGLKQEGTVGTQVRYAITKPLTDEEKVYLSSQLYSLTALGRQAAESVIAAVVQQLKVREPGSGS